MMGEQWYTDACREMAPAVPPEQLGPPVVGYDFAGPTVDYGRLLASFRTTGFQATAFGLAVDEINKMVHSKLAPKPDDRLARTNCTIFLGYTSNMISCGVRESIKFLVKNNMVLDQESELEGGVQNRSPINLRFGQRKEAVTERKIVLQRGKCGSVEKGYCFKVTGTGIFVLSRPFSTRSGRPGITINPDTGFS